MISCDLHQIVAESERLSADGRSILVDQIQQLLSVAAHGPGRHGPGKRSNREETEDEDKDGRPSRLRGAAILRSGASAATLESHHCQASAQPQRA
jgi:hypothetical protein